MLDRAFVTRVESAARTRSMTPFRQDNEIVLMKRREAILLDPLPMVRRTFRSLHRRASQPTSQRLLLLAFVSGWILSGLVSNVITWNRPHAYETEATLFGLPVFAGGESPNGVIAIGGNATGIIAIGGCSRGVVAIGGLAIGVFAVGGGAVGLFSFGGLSIGLVCAIGGGAFGFYSLGGGAFGGHAFGGLAVGYFEANGNEKEFLVFPD